LDSQELKKILEAANCDIEDGNKSINEFLNMLAKAHGTTLKEGRLETERVPFPIHCECGLLAKMHGLPGIPYIGVSKLSCTFCDMFFQAYRDATGSAICTRGTHGQTSRWACPTIDGSDVDQLISKTLSAKLLIRIESGWSTYRRSALDLQSTTATDEANRWSNRWSLGDGEGVSAFVFRLHKDVG
ncbi:hypothetical protein B0H17DRAFT_961824, partial [Mycena rosella]